MGTIGHLKSESFNLVVAVGKDIIVHKQYDFLLLLVLTVGGGSKISFSNMKSFTLGVAVGKDKICHLKSELLPLSDVPFYPTP